MEYNCTNCSANFTVTDDDRAFYERVSPVINDVYYTVPDPTLCPDCRMQRRMAFRCERHFYQRSCDLCKKNIISIYDTDAPCPVYCTECWWGDNWNAMDHAMAFDFSKPFFPQFAQLQQNVANMNMIVSAGENSEYSNYCSRVKNCYLLIAGDQSEDCLYGNCVWLSQDCMDCMNVIKCRQCYECIECEDCYHCLWSQLLDQCTDCTLCYDMKGCSNCFGCVGLRNKEYHWFNENVDRAEYEKRLSEITMSHDQIDAWRMQREPIRKGHPHKYAQILNCENSSGDSLSNCNKAQECYDCFGVEDSKYLVNGPDEIKDCYDFAGLTGTELSYEGVSIHGGMKLMFSERCWQGNTNVLYCSLCMGCSDCFGCIGLKKKQYCILNNQYTKEEYEELLPHIIEHMRRTKEYGEFFPIDISPFAYNTTIAQEYYPLTEIQAKEKGYTWKKEEESHADVSTVLPTEQLPTKITDVPDDILNWALECSATKRRFRIVKKELEFYKLNGIPIPRYHPDFRHQQRMALRNPHKLWTRTCDNCKKEIQSTFAPKREEKVYCEQCYLKEVY